MCSAPASTSRRTHSHCAPRWSTSSRAATRSTPPASSQLRNAGEELRRRFADLASRSYRHDHVDAAGDTRKRQLLEGPGRDPRTHCRRCRSWHPARSPSSGPIWSRSARCSRSTRHALKSSVILPGRTSRVRSTVRRPRPASRSANGGPPTSSRRGPTPWSTASTRRRWPSRSATSATPQHGPKSRRWRRRGTCPTAIDGAFINALNQVFNRVDIRNVSPGELTAALFPDTSPATGDQLRDRLDGLIDTLASGAAPNGCASCPRETTTRDRLPHWSQGMGHQGTPAPPRRTAGRAPQAPWCAPRRRHGHPRHVAAAVLLGLPEPRAVRLARGDQAGRIRRARLCRPRPLHHRHLRRQVQPVLQGPLVPHEGAAPGDHAVPPALHPAG